MKAECCSSVGRLALRTWHRANGLSALSTCAHKMKVVVCVSWVFTSYPCFFYGGSGGVNKISLHFISLVVSMCLLARCSSFLFWIATAKAGVTGKLKFISSRHYRTRHENIYYPGVLVDRFGQSGRDFILQKNGLQNLRSKWRKRVRSLLYKKPFNFGPCIQLPPPS